MKPPLLALRLQPAKWVALALFVAGLAGVSSAATDAPSVEGSTFDNLEITDQTLNGKIAVLRVGSEPSPNNLLTVFAGLKNTTAHTINLEVETIYKDADGNAVNSGSWIVLSLRPHEEKEYRSTSISEQYDPNTMTSHFLIRVRRAVRPGPGR